MFATVSPETRCVRTRLVRPTEVTLSKGTSDPPGYDLVSHPIHPVDVSRDEYHVTEFVITGTSDNGSPLGAPLSSTVGDVSRDIWPIAFTNVRSGSLFKALTDLKRHEPLYRNIFAGMFGSSTMCAYRARKRSK
jgi:hypothetical protein